ncbi:MAG: type I 3-dehydroquinate dehydratase [Acidobacteria bacterium]|nr:type I 3-dehydroquinate dehydratase [Acidobacteriota bacterium]
MSEIFLTIHEPDAAAALSAIAQEGSAPLDGFEIRADAIDPDRKGIDLAAFRKATDRLLVHTRRSSPGQARFDREEAERALASGFDLVDVEWSPRLDPEWVRLHRDRVILSHHDAAMPELDPLAEELRRFGAARIKIVVTPESFRDELRILELVAGSSAAGDLTAFGMGERALYSRVVAPSLGSRMTFVAREGRPGAPGQLTIDEIERADVTRPGRGYAIFAVVGSPVRHSRSPEIHNRIFRERLLPARYVCIEPRTVAEVIDEMADGHPLAPLGISVTTPFKKDAFDAGKKRGWRISPEAVRASAVNTIVMTGGPGLAANTDVDGFARLLGGRPSGSRSVAVIGAGATGRAAVVASLAAGLDVTLVNRDSENGRRTARELDVRLRSPGRAPIEEDVVIDTLPPGLIDDWADLIRPRRMFIESSYARGTGAFATAIRREAGLQIHDGIDLLHAQAVLQSELFVRAIQRAVRKERSEL